MFDKVLNSLLNDTPRLDKLRKFVLLWKPSAFMVFPIIENQRKAKTILHTVFETFISNNRWYKVQKVSWWFLWIGDARNIWKSFFHQKSLLELEVVYSSSFNWFSVFLKNGKRIAKNKYKKGIEKGKTWKTKSIRKA